MVRRVKNPTPRKVSLMHWKAGIGRKCVQGHLVTCARCGERTWARGADSLTLAKWDTTGWPDVLLCPACARRVEEGVSGQRDEPE